MVTEQLKQAYEAAQKLSPKDQDMLAKKILEEIEEQEWDELVASPESKAFLKKLTEETKAQIEAGEIEVGGFDCSEVQTHQAVQETL